MRHVRKNRTFFKLFEEKIEKTLPVTTNHIERDRLRRAVYTMRTKEAFLAIPPKERPLYAILDRIIREMPIQDNQEPLVNLAEVIKKRGSQILLVPDKTSYGSIGGPFLLRSGVLERLFDAEKKLQKIGGKHLTFEVTDTFRPLSLQRIYFERAKKEIIAREGLKGEELYERVTHLIADPETCPPHSTGGAIDLTVFDTSKGKELDMGTAVDAMEIDMIYLWHPHISEEAKDNRMLLYTAMLAAGFVNLPIEWWHYSYGDQEWALITGAKHAIYDSCSEASLTPSKKD